MPTSSRNAPEDARFRVLYLLEENPELSQRDLANALGISVGSTHYILRALIDKGFIKLGNFTASKDKRRYAYVLTRSGMREKAAVTKRFLARKLAEYEELKREITELRKLTDADLAARRARVAPKVGDDGVGHP